MFGFYYARLSYNKPLDISEISGRTLEIRGYPDSISKDFDNSKGYLQTIKVIKAMDEDGELLNLKEMRLFSSSILRQDRTYQIKVRIPKDAYFLNPGQRIDLISGEALDIREISILKESLFERARTRLNSFISNNFSDESGAFLMSIITGERSLIKKDVREAFNSTGLAHVLSISGAHFGLLLLILFRIFRYLIRLLPNNLLVRATLYFTPSQAAALLCMPFMAGYLSISSMSIPTIRAFIMIVMFLFGHLVQRKGFWLNTLLFAAVVIILIQPSSVTDLSFQLSFIAVLCIGMVAEQKNISLEGQDVDSENRSWIKLFFKRTSVVLKYTLSGIKISLAATIGTAPLVAYYFHYFSVVSPLTNLIITPFIGFIILPLALISSFIFLISGYFPLITFIDKLTTLTIDCIKAISNLNFIDIKIQTFPPVLLVVFYLALIAYIVLKVVKIGRYFQVCLGLIALLSICIYAGIKIAGDKGLHITYLDVGQGDSAVIECPDNKTLVIDTGSKGVQLTEFLRYRGIKEIDALILSHGQNDHAGGLRRLIENFRVFEIWDNGRLIYPDGLLTGIVHRKIQRGDVIKGGGYSITVLHPYDGFYSSRSDSDENNDSLVFIIHGRKSSFLFGGDIESEAEEDIVHLGRHLDSDVIKVPHHGSRISLSISFLNLVSPKIAVISVGRNNIYGHPHEDTIQRLNGVRIFRTDRDGAIGIKESGDGKLAVKKWIDSGFVKAETLLDEFNNLERLFYVW